MKRVACLLALLTAAARADSSSLAAEAERLAAAHDYRGAAEKFRAAYAQDPRPEYLCDVGVAYAKAKVLPKAHYYLTACARFGPRIDAHFLALTRAALDTVLDQLRTGSYAPLDISVVPDTATTAIDGADPIAGSHLEWAPFGRHALTVEATGYAAHHEDFEVKTRDPLALHVALVSAARSHRPRSRVWFRAAVSLTAASGALAVTAGLVFLHAHGIMADARSTTIDLPTYDRLVDRARTWQHASWLLGGLAGLTAGAAGFAWYRHARVDVLPASDGVAVAVAGRW